MRLHVLLGLVVLAIGFVVPTLAQEGNAVDPQVRKQIEELNMMYDEAFNKNDAVAVAALFTVDGVAMGPEGLASGQPDIVQRYLVLFQSHPTSHISKLVQLYAIGVRVCAITEWSATQKKHTSQSMRLSEGYIVTINVREGDAWKIQMLYWSYK
jgi:ketosteroid isomerase-like protein